MSKIFSLLIFIFLISCTEKEIEEKNSKDRIIRFHTRTNLIDIDDVRCNGDTPALKSSNIKALPQKDLRDINPEDWK